MFVIILVFFIIFIFFIAAVAMSGGILPTPFAKTAIFKNPKTGHYEEKEIDEKGNIIPEEKEIEIKKNNNEIVDSSKQDLIIAKIIKKEIDSQSYNELIWLKAFKKAKGNKQESQALYAEYRAHQLEEEYYQKNNPEENNYKKVNFKKIRSGNDNIFSTNKFLSGEESLSTAFWLYNFAGNLVVGVVAGMLSVLLGLWVTIFLIAYLIFSSIGLWKCADSYTTDMQRRKKSYGWAIAAKIYAVINLFVIPIQILLMVGK